MTPYYQSTHAIFCSSQSRVLCETDRFIASAGKYKQILQWLNIHYNQGISVINHHVLRIRHSRKNF